MAALIVWPAAAPAELVLNEAVVSPLEEQGCPYPGSRHAWQVRRLFCVWSPSIQRRDWLGPSAAPAVTGIVPVVAREEAG